MNHRVLLILLLILFAAPVILSGCGDDDDDDSGSDDDTVDDDDDTTDDDDDTGGTGDFEATLETNPICEISCVVTWTTDEPASSWIEFGEDSKGFTHIIGSDDLTTDHQVIVVGMHAEKTYSLQAVSETDGGVESRSQTMSFTAASLPEEWLAGDLDVHVEGQTQDGWTLTNLAGGSISTSLVGVMYDMEGEVIWYYFHEGDSGRMDTVFSFIDGKHVLVGPGVAEDEYLFAMDLAGEVVWEGPMQTGRGMNDDGGMHHVFYRLDDGNFITALNDVRDSITGDEIQIFNEDLNNIWTWNFWDHLTPEGTGPAGTWTHVNSVSLDYEDNAAYISSYTLRLIFKVDMDTDQIIWAFGEEDGDFLPDPLPDFPWLQGGHGVDYLGDDKFLAYDNGDVTRGFSRAVIFQMDETNMESEIIWEYRGEDEADQWYNSSVGDADYLDNGNVLIVAGNGAQNQSESRFIEVTPAGEKVWQLWLYNDGDKRMASFQADRIPNLAVELD